MLRASYLWNACWKPRQPRSWSSFKGPLVYLVQGFGWEPAREGFFPPFARQPVCHKAPCHRTNRRHQGVVKPQLFFPCGQEDRQHVHASRQRDDGVVEESERNKTHATELVDPVLDAARYRGRRACNSLVNEHFRTGPTSILACETRKMA